MSKLTTFTQLTLGLILSFLLLSSSIIAAPPIQTEDGEVYLVQAGDWLSKLAEKYYGDVLAYPTIVEATNNKAATDNSFTTISNADLIEVGQKLWIPSQADELTGTPSVEDDLSTGEQLVNVVWRWEQTAMNNDDVFIPENSHNYTVQFKDDNGLIIQADCNRVSGTYTLEDKAISIQLGPSTLVACPSDSLSDKFISNLAAAAIYFFEGDYLYVDLMVDSGTMQFSAQAMDLAGTSWLVTGYNNGKNAVVSPIIDTELTATFDAEGTLSGVAGCNNYTSTYKTEGDTVSIGPAASTRKACAEEGVMEQETQYLTALSTATTYQLRGDTLEFRTSENALAVSFQMVK